MKIGYIRRNFLEPNPNSTERFKFMEATCTRRISNRGDRISSKMLAYSIDYKEIEDNTNMMRKDGLILVCEPFFLDDELREKAIRWVEWANNADPKEYDPFA